MIFVCWAGPAAGHGIGNPAGRYEERGGEVIMAENQDVTMILGRLAAVASTLVTPTPESADTRRHARYALRTD